MGGHGSVVERFERGGGGRRKKSGESGRGGGEHFLWTRRGRAAQSDEDSDEHNQVEQATLPCLDPKLDNYRYSSSSSSLNSTIFGPLSPSGTSSSSGPSSPFPPFRFFGDVRPLLSFFDDDFAAAFSSLDRFAFLTGGMSHDQSGMKEST